MSGENGGSNSSDEEGDGKKPEPQVGGGWIPGDDEWDERHRGGRHRVPPRARHDRRGLLALT